MQAISVGITTSGSNGSAMGSSTYKINGLLVGLFVIVHASAPNTTDLAIKIRPDIYRAETFTLFSLTNLAASAYYVPLKAGTLTGGAAATTEVPMTLTGELILEVSQSDALTNAVVVTLQLA